MGKRPPRPKVVVTLARHPFLGGVLEELRLKADSAASEVKAKPSFLPSLEICLARKKKSPGLFFEFQPKDW